MSDKQILLFFNKKSSSEPKVPLKVAKSLFFLSHSNSFRWLKLDFRLFFLLANGNNLSCSEMLESWLSHLLPSANCTELGVAPGLPHTDSAALPKFGERANCNKVMNNFTAFANKLCAPLCRTPNYEFDSPCSATTRFLNANKLSRAIKFIALLLRRCLHSPICALIFDCKSMANKNLARNIGEHCSLSNSLFEEFSEKNALLDIAHRLFPIISF